MNRARYRTSARTQINRLRRDVDELFNRADGIEETNEVAGDLSRYICVRIVGYLEQALAYCGRSVCEDSWGPTQSFALSWLNRIPNPRSDEIIKFVARFEEQWSVDLERLLSENETGQSLNALLGIRNDIAHGRNQGVSRMRALEYYTSVDSIVQFLLDRFEPRR